MGFGRLSCGVGVFCAFVGVSAGALSASDASDDFLSMSPSSGGVVDVSGRTSLSFGYSASEGASISGGVRGDVGSDVAFSGFGFLSESSGRAVLGVTRRLDGGRAVRAQVGYLESGFESDAVYSERIGGFVLGYEFGAGPGRLQLRYGYSDTDFGDYAGSSAALTRAVSGDYGAHRVGYVYGVSETPVWGRYDLQFGQDVGRVDGATYFVSQARGDVVRFLQGPWRLEGSVRAGVLGGESEASSVATRFFGGGLVRGFDMTTAGPEQSGDGIGGERYGGLSVEVWRDLEGVRFGDLSVGAFVDAGAVWDVSGVDAVGSLDGYEARASGGLVLGWQFERGRLEVALSEPISEEVGDETHVLEVGFRSAF